MEAMVRIAWLLLAAVHVAPAVVLFRPAMIERLYGVAPGNSAELLLVHRGALFLAVVVVALFAALDPAARRAASLVTAISLIGYLLVYWRAGFPVGPLRTVALVDAVAILPLALASFAAWRTGATT